MSAIHIKKIGEALGAEVSGVDASKPVSAETFAAIRKAWLDNLVIRFRGQKLTDPQMLEFSRLFGELDPPGPNPYGKPFLPRHPEMNVISNVKEDGVPIGGLGDGEAIWHSDMTYVDTPPSAALLYALELPAEGGDTYWANMYLAYEALPADMKKRIKGLKAIHDATYNSAGIKRKGYDDVTDPRRRRNSYIVGLPLEESEALLDALWAHATQPRFAFCQRWQVGDLMIWDNRCTLHRRDPFDPNARRVMHRTQIKGDRP